MFHSFRAVWEFSPSNNETMSKMAYPGVFPGGSGVKNPLASAGDMGSMPGPGRLRMLQGN